MSQRIVLAVAIVMTLACLAAAGLTWHAIDGGRSAMAVLVEQNRETRDAVVRSTEEMRGRVGLPPLGFVASEVRIALATTENQLPLPPGFRVMLDYAAADLSDDGVAEFRSVAPGRHRLMVETPFGQRYEEDLVVQAGLPLRAKLLCPGRLPEATAIECEVAWPDDLREAGLWVVCAAAPLPTLSPALSLSSENEPLTGPGAQPTHGWKIGRPAAHDHLLAITPAGRVIEFDPREFDASASRLMDPRQRMAYRMTDDVPGLRSESEVAIGANESVFVCGIPRREAVASVSLSAVEYRVQSILIARSPTEEEDRPLLDARVVCGLMSDDMGGPWATRGPDKAPDLEGPFVTFPRDGMPRFHAEAGRRNRWKIVLPDELLNLLRERLASPETRI